jgi:CDP-diacylglycerol---glycerol-3-phosphate 3-phosphatidyltransferase
MNLPNKITLARIFLTFFFAACILTDGLAAKVSALVIFSLAAVTDYLDGWIAKRNNLTSDFGKIMDPLADKALTITAFVLFSIMDIVPARIVAIVILREVMVTGFRLKALMAGKVLSAVSGGKQKTFSQMLSIFIILIFLVMKEAGNKLIPFWSSDMEFFYLQGILVMMVITAILTVVSGVSYFLDNRGQVLGKSAKISETQ